MANLPAELVDDILLRLPVKPLLRFRCVSKRWLALIDSPDFIKLHLNRSIETKNNRTLMVREYSRTYLLNVDSPDIPVEIDHPLKTSRKMRKWESNWFQGSCNGLILMSYCGEEYAHDDTNFIWNPSTRNYHKLPFAEVDYDAIEIAVYGIGYDSVHDDYKVVRMIMYFRENACAIEVKVYSLKSNMWRRIQDFPYYFHKYVCHGVSSGGALHWLVCGNHHVGDPCDIAAFDLATEEYYLVPMPPNIDKFCNGGGKLDVLEGCLSICNYLRDTIDVWVMTCYGVRESWAKLISIGLVYADPYPNFITPLALSKDGSEFLFMHGQGVLIWVDLQCKIARTDVHGFSTKFQAEFVMQSLVPLGSGSGPHVHKEADQRKRKWIEMLDCE